MTSLAASPWTRRTRLATAAGLVCGGALVVLAAAGAGRQEAVPDEILWLNLGVIGLVVGDATIVLWLLAGRRAVTIARNKVVAQYTVDAEPQAAPATASPASDRLVTVSGSTWYHRPGCPLTAGKPVVDARADEDLAACTVCAG